MFSAGVRHVSPRIALANGSRKPDDGRRKLLRNLHQKNSNRDLDDMANLPEKRVLGLNEDNKFSHVVNESPIAI